MDEGGQWGRPFFFGRRVPDAFAVRRIVVAPGSVRPFDEAEWRDAIVLVESGTLELECRTGSRFRLKRGDVVWLIGLSLRALHNLGRAPTVLIAVSRRRTDEFRLESWSTQRPPR
jgi:quercetin dioxygenase-like cupin family protein